MQHSSAAPQLGKDTVLGGPAASPYSKSDIKSLTTDLAEGLGCFQGD